MEKESEGKNNSWGGWLTGWTNWYGYEADETSHHSEDMASESKVSFKEPVSAGWFTTFLLFSLLFHILSQFAYIFLELSMNCLLHFNMFCTFPINLAYLNFLFDRNC